jgi:hypothetical protein
LIQEYFNKEIFNFIKSNEGTDPFELSLRLKHFQPDIRKLISRQIQARQKIQNKIPEWLNFDHIILPDPVSIEQASSKITAEYKSGFTTGGLLVDLSGGLGVDACIFAEKVEKVIYVEKDPEISAIAAHNFAVMGLNNIEVICQSAELLLEEWRQDVDYFYLDPSRRTRAGKVFSLEDSEPNLIGIQDSLLERSALVITKASPFIDLRYAMKTVNHLKEIHVVAVDNECKEILLLSTKSYTGRDLKIITAHHTGSGFQRYASSVLYEQKSKCHIGLSGRYVYDPNAAIRKAGLFRSICHDFGFSKPANNSHIYFSDTLNTNFPGRIFELVEVVPFNSFIRNTTIKKANIAIRNFPLSVKEIRKRTKIQDGGDIYIFGTTGQSRKHFFIICHKVSYNQT